MPNIETIMTMSNAPLIGVFSLLFLACAYFFFSFCIPYWRITSRLKKVNTKLRGLDETSDLKDVVPEALRGHFTADKNLIHVWREYEETLHLQYKVIDGEESLASVRSTVPAEAFFNATVLVDTPLKLEFFKHLPGNLTGIGMIGTFRGLILALSQFDISDGARELISKHGPVSIRDSYRSLGSKKQF